MNYIKRLLIITLMLAACGCATSFAQDVITTRDGRSIAVDVVDVLGSSIYYRPAGAPATAEIEIIDLDDIVAVDFSEDNPLLAAILSWTMDVQPLDVDELIRTLYADDYNRYNLKIAGGYTCMLTGGMIATVGLCLGGISLLMKSDNPATAKGLGIAGISCIAGGGALFGIGIPIKNKGKRGQEELYERYRREYCSTLNVGSTGNGFGLAFRF